MKTNILKAIFLSAMTAVMVTSCVNDDDYAIPSLNCVDATITTNREVSQVISEATAIPTQYIHDDIIEAYVTSSDKAGNFFKSMSVQTLDGKYAFSIPVDNDSYFIDFEPGRKVYVKLQNLYTNVYNSSMIVGALYVNPATGAVSVGRLNSTAVKKSIIRSCTVVNEEDLVQHLSVAATKSDSNINKLIELSGVQFAEDAVGRTYYDSTNDLGGSTNHLLVDADGNSIIFRTSSFAAYALKTVPNKSGTIRGVLTKFGSDYQFIARSEDDIKLTNDRVSPLFEESFTSNFPNWVKYSVTGAQVWSLDTTFGNPGSCAKMSGFATTNVANEDWLISPAIDLTTKTSASLSFDSATKFAGDPIQALISTNYTGSGNPTTATWTAVTGTLSPSTGSYVWTGSGAIDITAIGAGHKIYVAFKYTSSNTAAATWEIDNVKVKG